MDYTFHYGTLNRLASRTLDAVEAPASAEQMNGPCFLLLVEEIERIGIDPFDITLGELSSLVELVHEKYNRNNRKTALERP